MEPQGCERHRWVEPRGRNERERVSQNLPSLDATPFSLRDPIFTPLIVRIMQSKQLRLVAEYDYEQLRVIRVRNVDGAIDSKRFEDAWNCVAMADNQRIAV
jgi:hypothetical protein